MDARTRDKLSRGRVRLRPETRIKWDAIKSITRWSDTVVADALADEYLKSHPEIIVGTDFAGDATERPSRRRRAV